MFPPLSAHSMLSGGAVCSAVAATSSWPLRALATPIETSDSSGYWSAVHDSASGCSSEASSASLTIGPWWVILTSSSSGFERPLTRISSRTTSALRQSPSNS